MAALRDFKVIKTSMYGGLKTIKISGELFPEIDLLCGSMWDMGSKGTLNTQ
jgi:hypothetical protein